MRMEGTIYCEAPDCPVHEHVGRDTMEAGRLPLGWLRVIAYGGSSDPETAYCCWDCLMKAAAQLPPMTSIPLDGSDDGTGQP